MSESQYSYDLDINLPTAPARLASKVRRGSKVLEIGTATGSMTRYFSENLECQITGVERQVEWASKAAKYCKKMHSVDIESSWTSTLFGDGYDFIILADVLEHLINPALCLQRLLPCLGKNGRILVTVPNVAYMGLIAALCCGQFPYTRTGLLDETHLRFFTHDSICGMFQMVGLNIVETEPINLPVEFSEFANYLPYLALSLRKSLEAQSNALAYQHLFVLSKI